MVPPGVWMEIGHDVGRRFMTGASIVQKCAVLPVSAMAGTDGGRAMVGGPTGARAAGSGGLATGITITSLRVTLEDGAVARGVGFPPGQAEDVGGGAEAGPLPRCDRRGDGVIATHHVASGCRCLVARTGTVASGTGVRTVGTQTMCPTIEERLTVGDRRRSRARWSG
ncbi:hypothetical protein MHU86_13834 [Fragilaria crotonensis]|nr:hypothetical protein MHU86_13834 [Fragilaria crotonensis]